MNLNSLKNQVTQIALQSSQISQKYYGSLQDADVSSKKNADDLVTIADKEIEVFLKKELQQLDLDAGFWGEESGQADSDKEFTWIVDPIDGTKYFSATVPLYSTVIALVQTQEPVLAVMLQPSLHNTIYTATKNHGVFRNNKQVKIHPKKTLAESAIYFDYDDFHQLESIEKQWTLTKQAKMFETARKVRPLGSGAIAVSWIERGLIDGFVDLTGRNPVWDMAAQRLIMTELGAKEAFIDVGFDHPRYVAAFDPAFEELVELIKLSSVSSFL